MGIATVVSLLFAPRTSLSNGPAASYEDGANSGGKALTVTLRLPNGGKRDLALRSLPGGVFRMGGSASMKTAYLNREEMPPHRVRVDAFAIMADEVTRSLYTAVLGLPAPRQRIDEPVTHVSWVDAVTFCNRMSTVAGLSPAYTLTQKDGQTQRVVWKPEADGFRLPTEAEFEYALRAGTETEYFWGTQNAADYAVFGQEGPRPTRSKKPNGFGLYDLAGNVWEWTWDQHGPYRVQGDLTDRRVGQLPAKALSVTNPNAKDAPSRVTRGGAFFNAVTTMRSSARGRMKPRSRSGLAGFRCVVSSAARRTKDDKGR